MTKKKLFRFKEIKLDPYPGVLSVFSDKKQFCEYVEWFTGNPHEWHNSYDGKTMVLVRDKERRYAICVSDTNTLVHELAHVALDVFEYINSDPRQGNGEPFCYLMGHLLNGCLTTKKYSV